MKYFILSSFHFIFFSYVFSQYSPTGDLFLLSDFNLKGNVNWVEQVCFSKNYLPHEQQENPNKKFKKEYVVEKKFNEKGYIETYIHYDFNHKNKFYGYNFKKEKPMKPPKYVGGGKNTKFIYTYLNDTIKVNVLESKFMGLQNINVKKIIVENGKTIRFMVHDLGNNILINNEILYNESGLITYINEYLYQVESKYFFEYDEQNNLIFEIQINLTNPDTIITKYSYNENNLVNEISYNYSQDQISHTYKYFYNETNQVVKLNFFREGEYDIDYFYLYNEKGDLIEEKTVFTLPEIEGYSKTYEYKYDKFDNKTSFKIFHEGVLFEYYLMKYKYYN